MKIAIVTSGLLPVPNVKGGGVETLVTSLLQQNELYELLDIVVYCIESEEASIEAGKYKKTKFVQLSLQDRTLIDRIRCRLTKDFPLETPYSFTKAYKMIKKESFDKIIVENSPWQFPFFVKHFGKKVILHLHNDWMNNSYDLSYQKRFAKAVNCSGGVWAISEYIKGRICQISNIAEGNIRIYHNATDTELYSQKMSMEERQKLRNQYKVTANETLIIYAGRMCKEKGVLEVVKAFKECFQKENTVKLLIVGSIEYGETTENEYTQIVAREIQNLSDQVVVTGFVNYQEMYKYYAISDIQVIPSMWEEPFGLVALEGMSQGLPIICTDSGGLSEVLDETCAMVVHRNHAIEELKDALEKLVYDEKLRKTMGAASKNRLVTHAEWGLKGYYERFVELLN